MAEDKAAYIDKLAHPLDSLVRLSEVLNYDFGQKALDEAFSDEELRSLSGLQAMRDRVVRMSGKPSPTVRDFVQHSGRGTIREMPQFIGTPKEIADGLEEWFSTGACDGFVLAATHMPGAYGTLPGSSCPNCSAAASSIASTPGRTLRENSGSRSRAAGVGPGPLRDSALRSWSARRVSDGQWGRRAQRASAPSSFFLTSGHSPRRIE